MQGRVSSGRALAFALAGLLVGCAGFRSVTRDMGNRSLVGEEAPELPAEAWVLPEGLDERDVSIADWKLIVIFRPD